ncbi:MAG: FAD-dependent oxidoreductase [Elusimicrobia bacterium]|nr:FAD-dependent oxidoreductase [Elusimicrobiota bacterium]
MGGALAFAALGACRTERELPGELLGPNQALGHKLRAGGFAAPSGAERVPVVIVGGGVAGLSAGWKLLRSGEGGFVVLDLESSAGGNAAWGENEVSRYPWGAHYLPVPGPHARAVRELLRELKVINGEKDGRPVYDEDVLCHAPEERLYIHGRWQDGLYPRLGASAADLAERDRFHAEIAALRRRVGRDGRPAFAIPMENSSRDHELLALDRVSMAAWLDQNGYRSPGLRWYVEYACRDDFGGTLAEVSAWAGLHYYAARGEGADDEFLVWPEGNGFLVRKLAEALGPRVRTGALAFDVAEDEDGVRVDYYDAATGAVRRILAKHAIVCAPRFVARRIVKPLREDTSPSAFDYAPWFVANLTVDDPPPGTGAAPAWDNVLYSGEGLGYVDATPQSFSLNRRRAVWTYYRPLTGNPGAQRAAAFKRSLAEWREMCLSDLERALPGLRSRVTRLDAWVWGHAMVLPKPGFIWGPERLAAAKPLGAIHFAHSDLSGFSIFEEANDRGVRAAEAVLAALGKSFRSSL